MGWQVSNPINNEWRSSSGTAEDRNAIRVEEHQRTAEWRSSSGTAEDRNL
ncbi:hypothetical protein [Streptomyces achromogenes]